MKNLRTKIDRYIDQLDKRWQALPIRKQHRYILYFFTGYLLLATGTVFKVWYDVQTPDSSIDIEHIESPVINNKNK